MGVIKKILLTASILILLILILYFASDIITKTTGKVVFEGYSKNEFHDCLSKQNITLYLDSNNLEKSLSELQWEEELHYINVFNCLEDNQFCLSQNINSFPTWIINTKKIDRDISISELFKYSGC